MILPYKGYVLIKLSRSVFVFSNDISVSKLSLLLSKMLNNNFLNSLNIKNFLRSIKNLS